MKQLTADNNQISAKCLLMFDAVWFSCNIIGKADGYKMGMTQTWDTSCDPPHPITSASAPCYWVQLQIVIQDGIYIFTPDPMMATCKISEIKTTVK